MIFRLRMTLEIGQLGVGVKIKAKGQHPLVIMIRQYLLTEIWTIWITFIHFLSNLINHRHLIHKLSIALTLNPKTHSLLRKTATYSIRVYNKSMRIRAWCLPNNKWWWRAPLQRKTKKELVPIIITKAT